MIWCSTTPASSSSTWTSASAPAADARGSGGARAVPAGAVSDRAGLVHLAQQIDDPSDRKNGAKARKILRDSILASTDVFKAKPYFLSDEFSLVDATIAPVLWRLVVLGNRLASASSTITKYANLLFSPARVQAQPVARRAGNARLKPAAVRHG